MGQDTDGWNLHSPDMKLVLSQVDSVWANSDEVRDEMWSAEDSRARASNANGFAMNGFFSGPNEISGHPRPTNHENWMNITIPGCERRESEYFKMIVSTQTANRANFMWNGTYCGSTQSEEWFGPSGTADAFADGAFSLSFTGSIDAAQSDELRAKQGSDQPEWVEGHDRENNVLMGMV
ncbi:hypothetical protein BJY01DRAFT_248503 [Aspergillus pseudoustus]|uniref:Uncharacterized protein n=1 Tax=Aspergillus pseudoustus TaxID=1810923 RepID=A0ABR4JUJ8_9EURO